MHFERYEVQKRLATGGMAEVFLSKAISQEGLERSLVIKRILPELCRDEDFVTTFINEARLAACLKHPNIVQIFDLGCVVDSYFLSMEYVRGFDLSMVIAANTKLNAFIPLPIALNIWIDMFTGLDFAHHATDANGRWLGVVHRDVTPGNVLVSADGDTKILDFGIAKATARDDNRTKNGTLKGKMSYLAPEQVLGQPVDLRADVYAGCLTIYELLANVNPNRGDTPYQSLSNAATRDARDLREVRPEIPESIAAIMRKGLSRDIKERYQTCGDVVRDLRRAASELGLTLSQNAVRAYVREHDFEFAPYALALSKGAESSDITGRTLYLRTGSHSLPKLVGRVANPDMRGPEICDAQLSDPDGQAPRPAVPIVMAPTVEPPTSRRSLVASVAVGCMLVALAVVVAVGHPQKSLEDLAPVPQAAVPELTFETQPQGALVLLSQPEMPGMVLLSGTTPLSTSAVVPDATYDYRVEIPGGRTVRGTFHLVPGERRTIRVDLRR